MTELISIKMKHLLQTGMLSDCYYYLGKIGGKACWKKMKNQINSDRDGLK
jgi:hypothetical protein